MLGASIYSIIIGKLCHEKKPCPIILLEMNKSLKVRFHYTILSFGLAVHLWVEGNEESLLYSSEIA